MQQEHEKYLSLLAKQYPTENAAAVEIINLQAILALPKGTEHFLTDIHGEYEQFVHVLKNGSGSVRRKIDEVMGKTVSNSYKRQLATLIYYPKEKLEIVKAKEEDIEDWYMMTLHHLVQVVKCVSSKYTRSKVRKAIPKGFVYVIEELITEKEEVYDKEQYYNSILQTIVRIGQADAVIVTLCELIQRMVVDHLHVIGDIYDRGPGPHIIMDTLCRYHSLDFVWGNHDVVWMGAAGGNAACIANVIRMSARYGNLSVLEDGYGINLLPLASFALHFYKDTDCSCFRLKEDSKGRFTNASEVEMRMYKAITMLQFKLEGRLIQRNPEFGMDGNLLLDKIDYDKKTVCIDGVEYPLKDCDFPTVDPEHPYELTEDEWKLVEHLKKAFMNCEKLQKHIRLLYQKGSLYRVSNGNLLYHGCVPMDENGEFSKTFIGDVEVSGKAMYDVLEEHARHGFFGRPGTAEHQKGGDILWYLWNGPKSPAYGRAKMATFERLFVEDKATHKEEKDPYYNLIEDVAIADKILAEFGADVNNGHIINGHVPVEIKKGETPIKCGGKVLMIDGGFSKAYHDKTGIAGYTLVSNSHGMRLVAHEQFETTEKAITEETDIISDTLVVENFARRMYIADTDIGKRLKSSIEDLERLLKAYQQGSVGNRV